VFRSLLIKCFEDSCACVTSPPNGPRHASGPQAGACGSAREMAPAEVDSRVRELLVHLPSVFKAWCDGELFLCASPSEEWEQQRALRGS
jgi:hypothetical protein